MVVLDRSGSIGRCEFGKGKKALKNMMKVANENRNVDTKYAAVSYSNNAVVNFNFLRYSTAARRIMQIPYVGGGSNTQDGLDKAKRLFEDPSSGIYFIIVFLSRKEIKRNSIQIIPFQTSKIDLLVNSMAKKVSWMYPFLTRYVNRVKKRSVIYGI